MTRKHLPDTFYNPTSVVGAVVAAASFLTILFLTFVEMWQEQSPGYIGVVTYIILPIPLIIGLAIIPIGILRERKRLRKGLRVGAHGFRLDLNDAKHRKAFLVFGAGTLVLFLFTSYGSYRTFEWTESVEFCGTTCHSVMEPEHTAYDNSPHARVKCVECHVGAGAGWYVRSKLSGAYQVYAVLADVVPRPIPTPIHNLRPAQETCEQCHWPSHFSGDKKVVNTYFRSDTANTRWVVALLMKIGGGSSDRGAANGIHWHMNIANEVTYAATDSQRQVIPWIRMHNRETGVTTEYRSTESDIAQEVLDSLPKNRMDCIDCHNRPSHIYRPPVRLVDQSLTFGRISTKLPGIRAAAIQALVVPYSSTAAAMDSIPRVLEAFFAENHPDALRAKKDLITQAANELREQYRKNFFPAMKVSWKVYPNNIGHMTDLGCFRCHDGKHTSPEGKVISKDCNSCHTILYQGTDPVPATLNAAGLPFQHPEDIGDAWMETSCKECHTGE